MSNLCKIIPVSKLKIEWLGTLVVERDIKTCRFSSDGKNIFLKLPRHIQSRKDVPKEHLSLFDKFAPYLKKGSKELTKILTSPEWTPADKEDEIN